jgi:hypothetical protein
MVSITPETISVGKFGTSPVLKYLINMGMKSIIENVSKTSAILVKKT